MTNTLPLVVITGPTASGKTSLSIRLAHEFDGEIISADSRAIYQGLDIGTAKPSMSERQGIPHWGFDLVEPGQRYTAVDFQQYAVKKIAEIRSRNKVPILVGGTGLYVDAVIYDFEFPRQDHATQRRKELERLSLSELYVYCHENNVSLPENYKNKRYVINAILRNGHALKRRSVPIENTVIVGITTEKNVLRERIHHRAVEIFRADIINEAETASRKYGWETESMTGNIYPLTRKLISGEISREQAIEQFETSDWRLAKRQLTWLRRNEHIRWLDLGEAYTYLAHALADVNKS